MRPRVFITQPVAASAIERLRASRSRVESRSAAHRHQGRAARAVPQLDILFCLLHDRVDRDVIEAGNAAARDRFDEDHARRHRRRGGHGAQIPVTVIAPLRDRSDRRYRVGADAGRRAARGRRRPADARGHVSRLAVRVHGRRGVSGKTLGLIGGGGDRKAVAQARAGLLDAHPLLDAAPQARGRGARGRAHLRAFDQLLAESDFVSLHARLTPRPVT